MCEFSIEPCKYRLIQKEIWMITVFLEPKDWVPSKRSLYADKGGKGIAGSDNTLTEESFLFHSERKTKRQG